MMKYFTVTNKGKSYPVLGDENSTFETVWASERHWFLVGSYVTISDGFGNSKTFRKGVRKDGTF